MKKVICKEPWTELGWSSYEQNTSEMKQVQRWPMDELWPQTVQLLGIVIYVRTTIFSYSWQVVIGEKAVLVA